MDCNWTLFKITRQPFWKWHSWQSLRFCLQPQRTCIWNLKLKFQSKLELRCQNHAIQKPKNLIWPPGSHYISTLPLKFEVDIQSQSKVSRQTKKSNMAARRPFWKWRRWISIDSYPYIYVLCHLSLQLIFKAKLKLESENQKFQYGCLAAILKLTLLKINRLLHIYISIVPLKFGVDIQSQTKLRIGKPKNPIWPPGGHFESGLAENQ